MTMRDDLAAELAACHEANEVDMPFWRAVASDVIGAGWRPRETYTTDSAEALADKLHDQWRVFKKHCPVGAYLPVGQLDGDCRECGGAWPCQPILDVLSGAVRREDEVRAEAWRASRLDLVRELRESGAWSEVRMAEWVEMRADRAALAEEGDR